MTSIISETEQSSDRDTDIQCFVSQEALQQVELRSTTPEDVGIVPIDSLPQLCQMIEAPGVGPPDNQLTVLLEARLSGESSLSTPSDTRYSVVSPQDSSQPQASFVRGNSASPAISSNEMGIRTDMRLESTKSHDHSISAAIDSQNSTSSSPDEWFPYTLNWKFLSLLAFFAAAMMITVIVLCWYSATNYGLGENDDSAVTFFAWRFAPSLFAVLYVQMTAMVLDDVKRTEPFARMARPGGAPGASTILQFPGAWWNALFDGISKKKNVGRRSWVLITASLINIIGFLTISPLSPSLLEPTSVTIVKPTKFTGLSINSTLPLGTGRETYLRILGNILQNVSTSAWITDEYIVLPVWPSNLENIPVGPSLSSTPQIWHAETIVMNTDLDCTRMELKNTMIMNASVFDFYFNETLWDLYPSISLSSSDGCIYNITLDKSSGSNGHAFWGDSPNEDWISTNQTSECRGKELIMSMTPSIGDPENGVPQIKPDFNVSAYICQSHYHMAKMRTAIHSTGTQSDIFLDKDRYNKQRTPVLFDTLDVGAAQKIAFSSEWSKYTPCFTSPNIEGLALPLAALYDFDPQKMIQDPGLPAQAKQIKQRIFGEAFQYSLLQQDDPTHNFTKGEVTIVERRIFVTTGVAITVVVLLQISLILLTVAWVLSRPCRRALNLRGDPAKTVTVCSLIANWPSIRQTGFTSSQNSEERHHETIPGNNFYTSLQVSLESDHNALPLGESFDESSPTSTSPIPMILRLRALCALLVALIAILVSLLVVYNLAKGSNLHQAFFTYEARITLFGHKSPSVAPLSIIPTLVAVGVGLWWSSIDATFRNLQPFLSMANTPTNAARGIALSYQSSYWITATIKAVANRHWFLCFITIGTTLSQILTISMSALFQRNQGSQLALVAVDRRLEMRDVPFVYETAQQISTHGNPLGMTVVKNLYTHLSTNWLYSATLQLTHNARQPRWSRDGWSFVPFETQDLANAHISEQIRTSVFQPTASITVPTIATRARLDCTPYEGLENRTTWLTHVDLTDSQSWNQSTIPKHLTDGYFLGQHSDGISGSSLFNTSFLPNIVIVQCCSNGTNYPPRKLALGYWSLDYTAADHLDISIKWVLGKGMSGIQGIYDDGYSRLIFTQVPEIAAIRCKPIIETVEASVTVDSDSGGVLSFQILSEPRIYQQAWSDQFAQRERYPGAENYGEGYFTVNSTTSFGVLFQTSLLTAADISHGLGVNGDDPTKSFENLDDEYFNIREPGKGLSLDFMTYSMYTRAGNDPRAFLNATTLEQFAQETFSTFFQHFVSSNFSLTAGGWAYQVINATLPHDLGALIPGQQGLSGNMNYTIPYSHINRTAIVQVSTPIQVLEINAIAVWLSICIIIWLFATTVIIGTFQRRYLRNLNCNINCVRDILVLVVGSEKLLRLVSERGSSGLDGEKDIFTKLGWFEDTRGQQRWGIEVVEKPQEPDENVETFAQVTSTTADGPSSYELQPTQSWRS